MPQIPSFPSVQQQGISGARLDPSAPSAAFAGNVNKSVDLSGAISQVSALEAEARQRYNQVAVSAADAEAIRSHTAHLWDPHSGAMNARGKDAIPAADAATDSFRKSLDDIEGTLSNDTQREAFRRRADMHMADLGGQLGQHVATQIKQYDIDVTNGHISDLTDAAEKAYTNPEIVQHSIDGIRAVLTDHYRANGHGEGAGVDQFAQQDIKDRISMVRSAVFHQLSATGQDLAAAAYLNQHRADFTGKDLLNDEKIADMGSTRATSIQHAKRILSTATTLTEAMAEVEKIEEPKIQDATAIRVRKHFDDQAADITHQRQQAFQAASAIVEKSGGNFDKVPLSIRVLLTPEENGALANRAHQITHPKRDTDPDVYHNLMNMAGLPGTRQQFLSTDLLKYRDALSETDYKKLLNLQTSGNITEGNAAAAKARADARAKAKADAKAAQTKKAEDFVKSLMKPGVPGAPIKPPKNDTPGTVDLSKPKTTSLVPQSWIDHANENAPDYADYLDHMGIDLG